MDLEPFVGPIDASDQVLCIATNGGAKSTLFATLTLDVDSLVVLDAKGRLTLPRARIVQLPPYDPETPTPFTAAIRAALAWQDATKGTNRVILRVAPRDVESFEAHDAIFWAVFDRMHTLVWIDEISATGATSTRAQPGLRAIAARGRTRGVGLLTASQRPFGMVPGVVKFNASYLIFGPVDPDDIRDVRRIDVDIASTIPRKSGRFIVYDQNVVQREPFRLYEPIPDRLKGWTAP